MKTTIIRRFKASYEEPVSITCNRCAETVQPKDKKDYFWLNKMQSILLEWGFGSSHDQEVWKFDLCENCLAEIIKEFKIPIETGKTE